MVSSLRTVRTRPRHWQQTIISSDTVTVTVTSDHTAAALHADVGGEGHIPAPAPDLWVSAGGGSEWVQLELGRVARPHPPPRLVA